MKFLIRMVERKELSAEEELRVLHEIRNIKPQARGAVVTSGGKMLPLSGSKKLNLKNTPVVLVEKSDREPVYIFPCSIGERYYSVFDGLEFLSQVNLPDLPELEGTSEDLLADAISMTPSLLEDGLKIISRELDTPTGRYDLLFEDKKGVKLIVEVERELSDHALGQILRLAAGYESTSGLKVRAGIAAIRGSENVELGARRAGVEIWIVGPQYQNSVIARKL